MSFLSFLVSEWTILIGFVLFAIYKWSITGYDFFAKKNVQFLQPMPLFGNLAGTFFQQESFFDAVRRIDSKLRANKFYGIFEMRNPLLVIRDPEHIKQVTVKDFDSFINHRVLIEGKDDPLFGNSLFSLKDQTWRDMRATLSPAFTGSKMRVMFQFMEETCKTAINYLKAESPGNKPVTIDLKEFFTRYTNDVVATTAFGVEINSLKEKDNVFYKMGRKATNFSGLISLKFFLFSNFRGLMRALKVKLFDATFTQYFHKLVLDTMKYRSDHSIFRPDMINLLMEVRKGELKTSAAEEKQDSEEAGFAVVQESEVAGQTAKSREWSDEYIVAQCFLFFIAGFETVSILMCFCAYELLQNPDVQEKLLEEVDAINAELAGKPLTYDVLSKMRYLDMVLSETLRKWPPAIATDRVCFKPYTLHDTETGQKVQINVGDTIWIPIVALHYDPTYYPAPEKFDPERFNNENKHKIDPFTYAPFGLGPRNCIGSRFALLESKAIIFHLLTHFTFEKSEKTILPIQLSASGFQLSPKGGFWIDFKPRK